MTICMTIIAIWFFITVYKLIKIDRKLTKISES